MRNEFCDSKRWTFKLGIWLNKIPFTFNKNQGRIEDVITDLNKLAKEIIEKNQYMTVASSDSKGKPWVSPVVYVQDKNHNLYFISLPDSMHSKNIVGNPNASVAIFDSHQNFGEGVGLQIEGTIEKVSLIKLPVVVGLYFGRKWPYANNIIKTYLNGFKKLLDNHTYQAYVFKPGVVWMNDPNSKIDVRVKIDIIKS